LSELRWHPLLEQWVITATHRQNRTFHPPDDYCPLCPTRPGGFPTEVPEAEYDIVAFENKFPSFSDPPAPIAVEETGLSPVRPARGICEVVCYTSAHAGSLTDVPLSRLRNLVDVWVDRYQELGSKDFIDYVFIFENKGKEIGVTLNHPHGQIYAFPFIPPKIQQELDACTRHRSRTGNCLLCDILTQETSDGSRVVARNDHFTAILPFFARLPYELYIISNRHLGAISNLGRLERISLANILKVVLLKYDNLWGMSLPYTMIMHQQPTDGAAYPDYHFHIEFHPIHRTADKLKYMAGCETGAYTYINDSLPEEKAAELRMAAPDTTADSFVFLEDSK